MHADDTEHPLAPGSLLADRYRVGERIGTGGTASVHRARDEVLGRDVALKAVVRGASDPAAQERERTEVELLARLSHRALVTVFDAVSARIDGHDSLVVVMELVDGPTLSQRRADGPIADAELLRMARDLAEALAVVHAAGIVHRDVKPSNILLAPSPLAEHDFDARLADFGIAAVDGGRDLTATGAVLGTAAYLSPEQATGGTVGPAADVYALGLVLLETITGEREFPGPAIEALTARMLRDPVMPPTLDEQWAWLLRGMTARDSSQRPTTDEVRELLAALEGVPVHVADPSGSDVATTVASVAIASAEPIDASDADAEARTALLPAVPADADAAASTAPVGVATTGADVEHLPARRRRRFAVLATVGLVLVAGAVGAGALAIQGSGSEQVAPSAPADEADPTTPSPTPSAPPTVEPEASQPATSDAPQPSTPAATSPAEPEPTTPTESPAPSETTRPSTEPTPSSTPEPTEATPTETTPADPSAPPAAP